jgi:transcription initiation factor TFIIA large subunit
LFGCRGADASANGSVSDVEKPKDGADLDEDLDDEEPAEAEAGNMVVAQYDKVVRNKNRWKCVMKHGIVHIDGREYVFSKATGEFVF